MAYKVKATRRRPSSIHREPGALPDEAVKTDLPVEGRLGRESLRAEPERTARTVKPPHGKRSVSRGGSSTKQKSRPRRPSSVRREPGALPDEAVKTDLPVEGRLGRESLRAEPERAARTAKPPQGKRIVSPGGSSTKQKSRPRCPSSVRREPGALLDEAVKTDLPVEGRSGRESLRAESKRIARRMKPPRGNFISPGEAQQKIPTGLVGIFLVRFQGLEPWAR